MVRRRKENETGCGYEAEMMTFAATFMFSVISGGLPEGRKPKLNGGNKGEQDRQTTDNIKGMI